MQFTVHILTAFAFLQPPVGIDAQRTDSPPPKSPKAAAVVDGSGPSTAKPSVTPATTSLIRQQNELGLRAQVLPAVLSTQLAGVVPEKAGLLVSGVLPDSPAKAAGLQQHDILISFDDVNLLSPAHLKQLIAKAKPGATVEFTILRALKAQTVSVKLGIRKVAVRAASSVRVRSAARANRGPGGLLADDTGPAAAGPRPSGIPRHYCTVEVIFDVNNQFRVVTEQCVDGGPAVKNDFTGSIDEVAAHYEDSSSVIRSNIAICLQTLTPESVKSGKVRRSVRILPRVENSVRFVRFVNVRNSPDGLPSVYIYDKRMGAAAAPGSLAGVTDDKPVRKELDKLPQPVRERIDQTVRQFKDAASVKNGGAGSKKD